MDTPSASEQRSVAPGQRWGLWVFDDGMYERLTVERVEGNIVHGRTPDDDMPCIVGLQRLLEHGDLLAEPGRPACTDCDKPLRDCVCQDKLRCSCGMPANVCMCAGYPEANDE